MLDQKIFGEKLRNHRKKLGMTQEDVAEKIGVSPQAISKWESGDCLPDCFNLKAISDVYNISADVLLETESSGDIDAVASKIEQLCTEFTWTSANYERYSKNLRQELGEDLWKMWKGIYFSEIGDRKKQEESKKQGNLRIIGSYGTKIWDDDGVACVVKSELIKKLPPCDSDKIDLVHALCSEDGQKLILALRCDGPTPKNEIIEKTGMELPRLNELLLMFTENLIIEYIAEHRDLGSGYVISGRCGVVAYMMLAAIYILNKKNYSVSQFLVG
jgi:transcriptional regulator with XRE-family HTH domain